MSGGRRATWPRCVSLVVALAYTAIIAANWFSAHWAPLLVGVIVVPAGTMWAGLTLCLRDLLHEVLGVPGVAGAIGFGAVLSWWLATPQIAVASVVAFTVSETINSVVYARLRSRSRLNAVIGANLVGLGIDSVLFVPLAFELPGVVLTCPGDTA
jgi:uncharacterized PurR-regulated membrane protein YhhQ (DUF165 family)